MTNAFKFVDKKYLKFILSTTWTLNRISKYFRKENVIRKLRMASGSSFRATLEHGSDFCCLSCNEDNKNSEAQYYCQDCSQCFCDVCLQLHNKLHKRHAVLGRKDIDKWSAATVLTGPLVRCEKHAGKILELECVDHRQLCCHVCVSIDHK